MRLTNRLLGAASALLLTGGMVAVALPATAAVTPVGSCDSSLNLLKLKPPLGDQTAPLSVSGGLAKDQTTKAAIAGTCSGTTYGSTLHVISQAVKLSGAASCANGATAQAADATAANAYPLNGKLTDKFSEIIAGKNAQIASYISALGFNPGGPDLLDVGGIVTKGVDVGAQVSGTIWEDPVMKTGGATGYNTGYELDLTDALGCADGTPNNATIAIVLSGGGGSTATSLLGSSAPGVSFSFGE